jgi:hypothetical protein
MLLKSGGATELDLSSLRGSLREERGVGAIFSGESRLYRECLAVLTSESLLLVGAFARVGPTKLGAPDLTLEEEEALTAKTTKNIESSA